MKDRARNFISVKAVTLMEGSLKDIGFIAEREFKESYLSFCGNAGKERMTVIR